MEILPALIEYHMHTLECMAREVFLRRPRMVFAPPIDLEFLIENEGDLTLATKSGLVVRYKVEGCVLKEEGTRELHVWIDHNIYLSGWANYNAVLAEEFAHIHLHKSLLLKVRTVEDFIALQNHPEWERYERDAKRFGRMLRMPAELFIGEAESIYRRLVNEHGFGDPLSICKLLRNALAFKFESSPIDAQTRMTDAACNIEKRALASVQAGELELLPERFALSARHERQPGLFRNESQVERP